MASATFGTRCQSGSSREAANELDGSVLWVGLPVSGVLHAMLGYHAKLFSK